MKFQKSTQVSPLMKALLATALMSFPVFAHAIDLPFVGVICDLAQSVSGPILGAIAVILIVAGGVAIAAGENSLFKWAGGALIGLSVAFGSAGVVSMLGGTTECVTRAI